MSVNDSEEFRRSLFETIAWYSANSFFLPLNDPVREQRRRADYHRAVKLLDEARNLPKRKWLPVPIMKTRQWQEASTLCEVIRHEFGDVAHVLRSDTLRPAVALEWTADDICWANAVAEVVRKRSYAMAGLPTPGIEASGRLLLYRPAENLACGGAAQSSNGFFDVDNVPPWDLWVSFCNGELMSWVPPALMELVDMGIDANPEQSIRWAD